MTLDESIKRIIEKIVNDEELRKLAILIDEHPEKKDEILAAYVMEDAKRRYNVPHHVGCKQNPAELCRQVDELYQDVFGDLDGLFKMIPCLHRFRKDML